MSWIVCLKLPSMLLFIWIVKSCWVLSLSNIPTLHRLRRVCKFCDWTEISRKVRGVLWWLLSATFRWVAHKKISQKRFVIGVSIN